MAERYHKRATDFGLRLSGAALCCVAWAAIRMLVQIRLADGPAALGLAAFALAALGFIAASAGAGLCSLGRHVFDEVAITERWR